MNLQNIRSDKEIIYISYILRYSHGIYIYINLQKRKYEDLESDILFSFDYRCRSYHYSLQNDLFGRIIQKFIIYMELLFIMVIIQTIINVVMLHLSKKKKKKKTGLNHDHFHQGALFFHFSKSQKLSQKVKKVMIIKIT